ncbi:MAG: hypothetical protein IJ519_02075 [Clostridia bacterium]|nr:hypothetical protein [Clostridia bacterium]
MNYRTELKKIYNAPTVEMLYDADDFLLCILGGKVITAIAKSKSACKELGCLCGFVMNGRSALALTEDERLFAARAISYTDGWEEIILLDNDLEKRVESMPELSERDREFLSKIKTIREKEPRSTLQVLLSVLASPVTRGIVGCLLLFLGLFCSMKKSLLIPAVILIVIGLPLCLFHERAERIRFAVGRLPFGCKRCDCESAVLIKIKKYAVCILLPFIKIPYSFKYYKGCASCYIKERKDRTNAELLLLTRTGIIPSAPITRKEYKKGRCN